MLEFVLLPQNVAFGVALAVMLLIAVMEVVGLMLGAGVSQLFENIFPSMDADVDIDIDGPGVDGPGVDGPDAAQPGILGQTLTWLRVGQVPFLVILVLFLLGFGLYGLLIQGIVQTFSGKLLPGWIAVIPAIGVTLPFIRASAGALSKVVPKDETSAVARDTFVGRTATITLGEAKPGSPAQAKLHDENNQVHYVMVEPEGDGVVLAQGESVRLLRQDGARFIAASLGPKAIPDAPS